MRLAALYDIHGNVPALEAVLNEVRRLGVDRIIMGGDVLPGPLPCESMAILASLDLPVEYIIGNGDRELLSSMRGQKNTALPKVAQEAIDWVPREFTAEHEKALSNWPTLLLHEIRGLGTALFCHATPGSDTENLTRLTPEDQLVPIFQDCGAQIVVCGHTHMQFDRQIGKVRVVNAGSVGMPFGEPGASWLLLDPHGIHLQQTPYDVTQAAERIRRTDYPQEDDFAQNYILHPPKEEAMLEVLSGNK